RDTRSARRAGSSPSLAHQSHAKRTLPASSRPYMAAAPRCLERSGGCHSRWHPDSGSSASLLLYLELDYHVLLLDRHRHCLGDVGPPDHFGTSGDLRRIGPRPYLGRLAPGLAGPDVELPPVPGATYHLALTDHAELARPVADRKPGDQAIA